MQKLLNYKLINTNKLPQSIQNKLIQIKMDEQAQINFVKDNLGFAYDDESVVTLFRLDYFKLTDWLKQQGYDLDLIQNTQLVMFNSLSNHLKQIFLKQLAISNY